VANLFKILVVASLLMREFTLLPQVGTVSSPSEKLTPAETSQYLLGNQARNDRPAPAVNGSEGTTFAWEAYPPPATPSVESTTSPTVTAIPSDTPTPAPTLTPSPTPSATPLPTTTPEPTATATPDPIDEDTAGEPVVYENDYSGGYLSLKANPPFIQPGAKVNLHWKLPAEAIDSKSNWANKLILPEGLVLAEENPAYFSGREGEINIDAAKGWITLVASEKIGPESLIELALMKDGESFASEQLLLPQPQEAGPQGDELRGNARVELFFPQGAVEEALDVIVVPLTEQEREKYQANASGFKVEAYSKAGKAVRQFARPIQLQIHYDETLFPGNEGSLGLFYYDEATYQWMPMDGSANPLTHTYTVSSDHLTLFNLNPNDWQAPASIRPESFQVSNFTGAATYTIPVDVPAGAGGLQPALNLSYYSQVVDQANMWTQPSWAGMGWSLDTPYITRDMHGTSSNVGDDMFILAMNGMNYHLMRGADGYYHTENETFTRIGIYDKFGNPMLPDSESGFPGHWVVKDKQGNTYIFGDPQADFRSYVSSPYYARYLKQCNVEFAIYRWSLQKVTNPAGKELRYDYTERIKMTDGHCNNLYDDPYEQGVYPKEILYPNQHYRVYFDFSFDRLDVRDYWTWGRNSYIYDEGRLRSIQIQHDADGDGDFSDAQTLWKYELTYTKDNVAGLDNAAIYPNYVWDEGDHNLTLNRVQKIAFDDGATAAYLPPLLFHYADGMHLTSVENGYGGVVSYTYDEWYSWDDNGNPYNNPNYPGGWKGDFGFGSGGYVVDGYSVVFLRNNIGYPGSRYEFNGRLCMEGTIPGTLQVGLDDGNGNVFKPDGQPGYDSEILTPPGHPCATRHDAYSLPSSANPHQAMFKLKCQNSNESLCRAWDLQVRRLPTFYRVSQKTFTDTVTGASYSYSYQYEGASVNNEVGFGNFNVGVNSFLNYPFSTFRGHTLVREAGPDGRVTETTYHQLNKDAPTLEQLYLTGTPIAVTSYGPASALPLASITYTYATNAPVAANQNPNFADLKLHWTRTLLEVSKLFTTDGAGWMGTRSEYTYDPLYQGGAQYGNLTQVVESAWEGGQWVDVRLRWRQYVPVSSATTYISGLPAVDSLYTCSGTLDGNCFNEGGGAPAAQNLLASSLYLYDNASSHLSAPTVGLLTGQRLQLEWQDPQLYSGPLYRDVQYTYDSWGNPAAVSQYDQKNGLNAFAAGTARSTLTCYGDPVAGAGCADDGYYTYPLWQRNALGQTINWSYDKARGLPLQQTGLNGEMTTAAYDAFGRLLKLARPGDSAESPTVQMVYGDFAVPFSVQTSQKIDETHASASRIYYDGFGQPIQQQQLDAEVDGSVQDVLVSRRTRFDPANGLTLEEQSQPYAVAPEAGYQPPVWSSLALTTTSLDVLGRPVETLLPDGSGQSSAYSVDGTAGRLQTSLTDARGNVSQTFTDAFGNVRQVTPPTGPGLAYTYDAAGRLLSVSYGSALSSMSYDLAGNKTGMDDADMGAWSYTYDALGNLATQTDARGCQTALSYDLLDRLTGKTYTGSGACDTTPDVAYFYDNYEDFPAYSPVENHPVGQRTGMSDGSGHTIWEYDAHGRTVQESVSLSGVGEYATAWAWNSADWLTAMTYPNGEVVEYAYNPQGLVERLDHGEFSPVLASLTYDAAGRILERTADGGLETVNSYYPWDAQGGRLATIQSGIAGAPASLQDLSYTYDSNGNIETILDGHNAGQRQCFGYDAANRLTAASTYNADWQPTLGCTAQLGEGNYDERYSYDALTGDLASKAGQTLVYADSLHSHAATGMGTSNYAYDANGNMTSRTVDGQTYSLEYDAENRLIRILQGANEIAHYSYNGDGERVLSIAGPKTTVYIGNYFEATYDPAIPLPPEPPEIEPLACILNCYKVFLPVVLSPGNGVSEPPDHWEWRSYYYAGTQRLGVHVQGGDRPAGGERFELLADHLGSTMQVLDQDSSVIAEELYRPWGETRCASGSLPTQYQYTGQKQAELGLYDYGARWYDPALGRFLSPDSIIPGVPGQSFSPLTVDYQEISLLEQLNLGNGGSFQVGYLPLYPQAYDRYAYAFNNPIRYNDPDGHDPISVTLGLGLVLTIGAPEIVLVGLVVVGIVVAYDALAPGREQRHEDLQNLWNQAEGSVAAVFSAGKAGGAAQAAQHLSMLLGGADVAGFGSHPGMPDPDGRDRKHNVEGLRNTLKDIQKNMRKGESINDFLTRQGWGEQQIQQFNSAVNDYVKNVLPTDVKYYGVSQNLADEIVSLVSKIGIR